MRQQLFDPVHNADDVGARLTLNVDDHGWGQSRLLSRAGRSAHPRGQLIVLYAVDDIGNVAEPHRRAVVIGNDNRFVLLARKQLVIGANRVRLP